MKISFLSSFVSLVTGFVSVLSLYNCFPDSVKKTNSIAFVYAADESDKSI